MWDENILESYFHLHMVINYLTEFLCRRVTMCALNNSGIKFCVVAKLPETTYIDPPVGDDISEIYCIYTYHKQ
jgi:hypothetical protein